MWVWFLLSWFEQRAFYKALSFYHCRMITVASGRIALALFYLIFISVLFCLPGSALPKATWLSKVHFDKWVHAGFFFVLIVVWLWALKLFHKPMPVVVLGAALYGLIVELTQHYFIPNRSFDAGDWMADMAGACVGLWFWKRYIKK